MLVDSHCHLDFDRFDEDREDCLKRAVEQGVGTMLTISTHVTKFPEILTLANSDERLYCSVGVHPHQVAEEPETATETLVGLTDNRKVVGIGETGLDYFYDNSPRDDQRASFIRHMAASRQTGLPLIVNTRDADDDMAEILTEEMGKGAFPYVLHCFSSGHALAITALELGCYISISGIVTFKNAADLRETVKDVPLDRLLVETDAPFLAPIPHRGKRNEPAFVIHTVEKVAELKAVSPEALADATTENFFRLFSKAQRPDTAA